MSPRAKDTLLHAALIGGAVWIVWRMLKQTANVIAAPVGDAAVALQRAFNPVVQVNAQVRLPSGSLVNPAAGKFLSVGDNTAQWQYGGRTYTLGARDASGIYPAR